MSAGAIPSLTERGPRRLGPWHRLLAFGVRWPQLYRKAHLAAMILLPVELLTGAILYFPALHTALIPALPVVLGIHEWAGVLFGILLLIPLVVPLGRRLVTRLDWHATIWLVSGLTLTGLGLWLGGVAGLVRQGAFTVHGALSVLILLWVAYHALVRIETGWRGGDAARAAEGHVQIRRRRVLAQTAKAMAGMAALTAVTGVAQRAWAAVNAVTSASANGPPAAAPQGSSGTPRPIPGFQIYTVTDGIPDQAHDPSSWRLTVEGAVGKPLTLSLTDLLQLPQTTITRDFHCVTGWVVPQVTWVGVSLSDLLAQVQPTPAAAWITFDSFDGVYTDSLSLQQASASGVLLAHHADGRPLAPEQGAPVRLLVPQMYGYKSVKWLARLRLVASRELGYWEQRGYGPDAYLGTTNGWPGGSGLLGGLLP